MRQPPFTRRHHELWWEIGEEVGVRGPPPRDSSAPRSAEITSPVCAVAAVARAAPVLRRRTQRRRAELGGLRRRDGARAVGRMGPNVGLVIILNAPQIRAAAIRANVEHDDPCINKMWRLTIDPVDVNK